MSWQHHMAKCLIAAMKRFGFLLPWEQLKYPHIWHIKHTCVYAVLSSCTVVMCHTATTTENFLLLIPSVSFSSLRFQLIETIKKTFLVKSATLELLLTQSHRMYVPLSNSASQSTWIQTRSQCSHVSDQHPEAVLSFSSLWFKLLGNFSGWLQLRRERERAAESSMRGSVSVCLIPFRGSDWWGKVSYLHMYSSKVLLWSPPVLQTCNIIKTALGIIAF